jgi:hypothetical protein
MLLPPDSRVAGGGSRGGLYGRPANGIFISQATLNPVLASG